MSIALVTGSAGLIGSEAVKYFSAEGLSVVGIDNDMRSVFFGPGASTAWSRQQLVQQFPAYEHVSADIRDREAMKALFSRYGSEIVLVIHAAAQPSHDWAARDPFTDFDINAGGTLNLLQQTRTYCPEAVFIFTSTNKVYGDRPNSLPLRELDTRWEIEETHTYHEGIREDMAIDACLHSIFGASKLAADIMVQEFGKYFGMRTTCFRGGTLTGPAHAATELHGFLGYVMRCAMTGTPYTVHGYKGKQVRDAIHSLDLIRAFAEVFKAPRVAEVYNIGGGRASNVSVLEAIAMSDSITGDVMDWSYSDRNRVGDHLWWIGSNARFQAHYPDWTLEYDVLRVMTEIHAENREKWSR